MTNSDPNRSQVERDKDDIMTVNRGEVQLTGVHMVRPFHSRVAVCCLLSLVCLLSIAIARDVLSSCGVITLPSVHARKWEPDPLAGDVGSVLLKYLRLIVGKDRMALESVVDDLLIHLLAAMGFNQGNLLISSHTIRHTHSMALRV